LSKKRICKTLDDNLTDENGRSHDTDKQLKTVIDDDGRQQYAYRDEIVPFSDGFGMAIGRETIPPRLSFNVPISTERFNKIFKDNVS